MDASGGVGGGDMMGLASGRGVVGQAARADSSNAGGTSAFNGNSTALASRGNNETSAPAAGNSTRGQYTAFSGGGTRLG